MTLIFCLDNKRGMMFNSRRQSSDRVLRERVITSLGGARLIVSPYTAKQFADTDPITVAADPISIAERGDACFIEDTDVRLDGCDRVMLYFWNRDYPADKYFLPDLAALGFKLVSAEDFGGYSHEKITEKVYVKE